MLGSAGVRAPVRASAEPAAGQRRRDPGQARPGLHPRAGGVPPAKPQGRRPRPGLRRPLQQGDRARLVRRGRGARPAVPEVRPRRAGQGAGPDHPDDGARPGRPVRRGPRAVPRADQGLGQNEQEEFAASFSEISPPRRSPPASSRSPARSTRRCSRGSARARTCARRSRPS